MSRVRAGTTRQFEKMRPKRLLDIARAAVFEARTQLALDPKLHRYDVTGLSHDEIELLFYGCWKYLLKREETSIIGWVPEKREKVDDDG